MAASNLVTRLATAAVAGPLILLLLFLGPAWAWGLFIALATAIGALELFHMTHPDDRVARVAAIVMTLGVFATLWFFGANAKALMAILLLVPLTSELLTLARLGEMKTAAFRVTGASFGQIYLGAGMASLALIKKDGGADGPAFVLLALMLSWLSDTGAYFAGRFLGKHKLYEAVSPKKTVEGAIGGLAGGTLGAVLVVTLYLKSLPITHALALAIFAGGLGQLGDLGESLLKRSVGVKDSGGIVPGHGGILDRVDALLVTGTFCYLYILFVRLP